MAGTASPGAPGPSVAPPPLPSGWIAQWDESTRKYYYVELGTGRSQWDVPTQPAPTAISTPSSGINHPYGVPPGGPTEGSRIITHPDGSQTVQHPDGRMEPILPGGPDGTRGGIDGPAGDRGFGSFAQSALNSFGGSKASGGGGGANPLGSLASSLLGGGGGGSGGGGGGGGAGGVGNFGGKVVSGLASSLFSPGNDKPQPQNYHGGPQVAPHSSGGLAGSVMGSVATMFGGNQPRPGQNFGYSNTGPGTYSGTAPPISYQPPSQPGTSATISPTQPQHQQQPLHSTTSYQQPQHSPSYQQPQHQQQPPYGGHPQQPPYGGQPQGQYYGSPQPPQYGHQQPPYGGQQQHGHYGGGHRY